MSIVWLSYAATVLTAFPILWFVIARTFRDGALAGKIEGVASELWKEGAVRRSFYAFSGVFALVLASAWLQLVVLVVLLRLSLFLLHHLDDHDALNEKMERRVEKH